jgi:nucleoside-diphosphate-sugar epimerase
VVSADSPTILTTGGTGLVGRAIVRRLLAAGQSVRVISRGDDYPALPGVSVWRGDVTRVADVASAMRGCHAVFHCAAEMHDRARMAAVNISATRLLLDLACDLKVGFFCHLSSVAVIGRTGTGIVDEGAPCNPLSLYAETKLAAEEFVGQGLPGGNVVILRPTNIFGPETLGPWIQNSLRSKVRAFLHGRERAHLVYVEDVAAAAVHWFQNSSGERVETFIVSSDEEPGNTDHEVRAVVASMAGTAARLCRLSAPLWVARCARAIRYGHGNLGKVIYSSRRLHQAGYQFPFGLRNGLDDAVRLWRAAKTSG